MKTFLKILVAGTVPAVIVTSILQSGMSADAAEPATSAPAVAADTTQPATQPDAQPATQPAAAPPMRRSGGFGIGGRRG